MKTGHQYHRDSFGQMQTVLSGVTTWTLRALRSTKVAVPHIAKNDVFSYKCQLNHDKELATNLDSFHLHMIPITDPASGDVIAIDYGYTWLADGDTYPLTMASTGTAQIQLDDADQFKYLIKAVVTNITAPTGEGYSSEFIIQCTRRKDALDTYAGEFALLDGDVHYKTNHLGSYYEFND